MSGVLKDGVDEPRMIKHGVARFASLSSRNETQSVCERASVRTTKSKSAAVNRSRQFARIIGIQSMSIGRAAGKTGRAKVDRDCVEKGEPAGIVPREES